MRIIHETEEGSFSLPTHLLTPKELRPATGKLAVRILTYLADHPDTHAAKIAHALREPGQKLHYHLRMLRKAGIIKATDAGTVKTLRLAAPAFCMALADWQPTTTGIHTPKEQAEFLSPFIRDGRWDACIVVGSPDPHGPEQARSRDASSAIDLALFLGSHLSTPAPPSVVWDTELRDWNRNLIIIGGPVVNKAAERVNTHSPAPYDRDAREFRSTKTGNRYGSDHIGTIAKFRNPFVKQRWILLVSGKRYVGTHAAILAFLHEFPRVCKGAMPAGSVLRIVEGIDADSDGSLDTVRILE